MVVGGYHMSLPVADAWICTISKVQHCEIGDNTESLEIVGYI
jgi:hypothetical protein